MITVTVDDVQRDLAGCLGRMEAGETVVIVKDNEPIAEMKRVDSSRASPGRSSLCGRVPRAG